MPRRKRFEIFSPRKDGRFDVDLPDGSRQALVDLAGQLDALLTSDGPEVRRLFPTAYNKDPDRDAGYQVFARDQLIEKRQGAIEILRTTIEAESLSEEDLAAWMGVLNDFRLVLGTILDVSEDDHGVDFDAPDAQLQLLYRQLGWLVEAAVVALTTALPEPEDD